MVVVVVVVAAAAVVVQEVEVAVAGPENVVIVQVKIEREIGSRNVC